MNEALTWTGFVLLMSAGVVGATMVTSYRTWLEVAGKVVASVLLVAVAACWLMAIWWGVRP